MYRRRSGLVLALVASLLGPPPASAGEPPRQVTAELDGKAIELAAVGSYHCHDFDYPRIRCTTSGLALDNSVEAAFGVLELLGVTAVSYVRIFENSAYGGASMYVSQDYSALAFIGWNDRISSFRAQNSETGSFYWEWMYGGTPYTFCCNQNVSSLGSWNDNISSVMRT